MPEQPSAHVSSSTEQGVLVLTLTTSEVRSDDVVQAIGNELQAAVGPTPPPRIVLDLHSVQYLGSSGFRPLLNLRRTLLAAGSRLVLSGLSAEVAEVFRITRLISSHGAAPAPFVVETDVPAAIAHLNREP